MASIDREQEFLEKLGKHIVYLRNQSHMKQIELATKMGIEDSALRRIETGRTNPTVKTLLAVADGLGVEFVELFSFSIKNLT